jgi:hypothetical protein
MTSVPRRAPRHRVGLAQRRTAPEPFQEHRQVVVFSGVQAIGYPVELAGLMLHIVVIGPVIALGKVAVLAPQVGIEDLLAGLHALGPLLLLAAQAQARKEGRGEALQ